MREKCVGNLKSMARFVIAGVEDVNRLKFIKIQTIPFHLHRPDISKGGFFEVMEINAIGSNGEFYSFRKDMEVKIIK